MTPETKALLKLFILGNLLLHGFGVIDGSLAKNYHRSWSDFIVYLSIKEALIVWAMWQEVKEQRQKREKEALEAANAPTPPGPATIAWKEKTINSLNEL